MPLWLLSFIPGLKRVLKALLNPRVLAIIAVLVVLAIIAWKVNAFIKEAEAAQAQVAAQQKQIGDLTKAVRDERASVDIATKAMKDYQNSVAQYAKDQAAIVQQVAGVRHKLDTTPILQKAQTNAQGADTDLNSSYSGMLGMFDNATSAAASASGGSHHPGQASPASP